MQRALSLRRHSDAMDSEVDSSTVLLRNNLILHAFTQSFTKSYRLNNVYLNYIKQCANLIYIDAAETSNNISTADTRDKDKKAIISLLKKQ